MLSVPLLLLLEDCCALIIEFHRRGLVQKEVLDDDMDVVRAFLLVRERSKYRTDSGSRIICHLPLQYAHRMSVDNTLDQGSQPLMIDQTTDAEPSSITPDQRTSQLDA
jgi:hypothetical protein